MVLNWLANFKQNLKHNVPKVNLNQPPLLLQNLYDYNKYHMSGCLNDNNDSLQHAAHLNNHHAIFITDNKLFDVIDFKKFNDYLEKSIINDYRNQLLIIDNSLLSHLNASYHTILLDATADYALNQIPYFEMFNSYNPHDYERRNTNIYQHLKPVIQCLIICNDAGDIYYALPCLFDPKVKFINSQLVKITTSLSKINNILATQKVYEINQFYPYFLYPKLVENNLIVTYEAHAQHIINFSDDLDTNFTKYLLPTMCYYHENYLLDILAVYFKSRLSCKIQTNGKIKLVWEKDFHDPISPKAQAKWAQFLSQEIPFNLQQIMEQSTWYEVLINLILAKSFNKMVLTPKTTAITTINCHQKAPLKPLAKSQGFNQILLRSHLSPEHGYYTINKQLVSLIGDTHIKQIKKVDL